MSGESIASQDGNTRLSPVAKRVRLDNGEAGSSVSCGVVESRMTETRAGITAYIHPDVPGFQGIIKQRFTDFMVNEIDLLGNVCRLTSLDPPAGKLLAQSRPLAASSDQLQAAAETAEKEQAQTQLDESAWPVVAEEEEKLKEFFSVESIESLKEMWAKGKQGTNMATGANATVVSAASIVTKPLEDKVQRTQVHKLIRELFHGKLATDSCQVRPRGARAVEEDRVAQANAASNSTISAASTLIAVRWANRSDRRSGDGLSEEAASSPPYIHFLLHKTNRDHQEAMGMLAESLRLGGGGAGRGRGRGRGGFAGRGGGRPPTKDLAVAGTKDKRAVTVQRVSLRRNRKTLEDVYRLVNGINADVSASKVKGKGNGRTVLDAVTSRADRGIRIGHLEYAHEPLKLGQLKGNEFTITLRNVRPSSSSASVDKAFLASVRRSMDVIRDRGFINYFGMQRFGTGAIPTHHIGILVLRNDFKTAIDLLFEPRPPSSPDADDGDSLDLLKAKQLYKEGELDKAYSVIPKNCVAEKHILDKMRSSRWNKGDWMGAFGNIPRTLRLMYVHAYQSYVWNRLVSERVAKFGSLQAVEGDLVFADKRDEDGWQEVGGEDEERPNGTDGEAEDDDDLRNGGGKINPLATWQRPIKVLTTCDVQSDQWSIYDVILPLPGSSIDLPVGWMSDLYTSILTNDSLTHTQLTCSKFPDYQLNGSYRPMLVKPRNLTYSITSYTDPDIPLTHTDEELCLDASLSNSIQDDQDDNSSSSKFTALTLRFQLPSSSYATMLMREALKSDTSSFKHRQMTQKSEDQHFKGSTTQA